MEPRGILSRKQRTGDAQADLSFDVFSSHDAIHFLRIFFCLGWIRVAIGIILGIERLPAQDSYDKENFYYYMIETHTKIS